MDGSDTLFGRRDARTKIVLALGLVVAVASVPLPNVAAALPLAALVATLLLLARLPLGTAGRTLGAVAPFAAMAACSLPFLVPGSALWSTALGPVALQISREGLISAADVLGRALTAALVVSALAATTPFDRLAHGLRGLGLPPAAVLTLCSLHRYIPVVGQEALRLVRAARARAGRRGTGLGGTGALLAALLLRSLDRADRVHRAMVARGFDGTVPDAAGRHLGFADLAWLALGILAIATGVVASVWVGWR